MQTGSGFPYWYIAAQVKMELQREGPASPIRVPLPSEAWVAQMMGSPDISHRNAIFLQNQYLVPTMTIVQYWALAMSSIQSFATAPVIEGLLTGEGLTMGAGGAGVVADARAAAWSYGELPEGVLGATDKFGNVTIARGLSPQVEAMVIRHESVHAFLSPGTGALQGARANLLQYSYNNSQLVRYTEEALAQGYATRSIIQGLTFPITHGYNVTFGGIALEGAAYATVVVGPGVAAYELSK